MFSPTALVFLTVSVNAATTEICRFVCPDIAGGLPLVDEFILVDGSVPNCVWDNNGVEATAVYDSNGDAIFTSSNDESTKRAKEICVTVTEGWTFAQGQVCLSDSVSYRILAQDTIVPIDGGVDPATCTAQCDVLGYTSAGVEFGGECHCGNGYGRSITAQVHTECNMPCTGNETETCGGPNRIEVFFGPFPPRAAQLPSGWSVFNSAVCAQDSVARMFTDTLIAGPTLASIDTPAACVQFCIDAGFDKAGVEGGDECYCGSEFRESPQALDPSECNLPCQGAPGVTCGGNFAIQLYTTA